MGIFAPFLKHNYKDEFDKNANSILCNCGFTL